MMFAERKEETDDLVQEALIHLWQGFRHTEEVCRSWVWRVTMNSCISIDRKKKRRSDECAMTADIERVMQTADAGNRNANVQMLYDSIHQLNPFDRAIVML